MCQTPSYRGLLVKYLNLHARLEGAFCHATTFIAATIWTVVTGPMYVIMLFGVLGLPARSLGDEVCQRMRIGSPMNGYNKIRHFYFSDYQ